MQKSARVRTLHVATTATFVSTLACALLVFIAESSGGLRKPQIGDLGQVLPYVFLVIVLVSAAIGQLVAAQVAQQRPLTVALIGYASAEAAAILGLILYLLLHSVQWFAIFIGLSWVAFVMASFKVPGYAAMLDRMDQRAGPPS